MCLTAAVHSLSVLLSAFDTHVKTVSVPLTLGQADPLASPRAGAGVPWLDQRALILEMVFSLLIFLPNMSVVVGDAREADLEDRRDFLRELRTKHRRSVAETIVEQLLPPPVVSEVSSKCAFPLPPALPVPCLRLAAKPPRARHTSWFRV